MNISQLIAGIELPAEILAGFETVEAAVKSGTLTQPILDAAVEPLVSTISTLVGKSGAVPVPLVQAIETAVVTAINTYYAPKVSAPAPTAS